VRAAVGDAVKAPSVTLNLLAAHLHAPLAVSLYGSFQLPSTSGTAGRFEPLYIPLHSVLDDWMWWINHHTLWQLVPRPI
jgi:hypothetical protein